MYKKNLKSYLLEIVAFFVLIGSGLGWFQYYPHYLHDPFIDTSVTLFSLIAIMNFIVGLLLMLNLVKEFKVKRMKGKVNLIVLSVQLLLIAIIFKVFIILSDPYYVNITKDALVMFATVAYEVVIMHIGLALSANVKVSDRRNDEQKQEN